MVTYYTRRDDSCNRLHEGWHGTMADRQVAQNLTSCDVMPWASTFRISYSMLYLCYCEFLLTYSKLKYMTAKYNIHIKKNIATPPSIIDVERQLDLSGTYVHKNLNNIAFLFNILHYCRCSIYYYIIQYCRSSVYYIFLIALLNSKLINYYI